MKKNILYQTSKQYDVQKCLIKLRFLRKQVELILQEAKFVL